MPSHLVVVVLLIAIAAALLAVVSCSGDAKSAADSGYAHLGKGENKAALEEFDAALQKLGSNTQDPNYLRAAIGRCQARAHVDPKRAREEFVELAKVQQGKIVEGDFSLIANELLRVNTNVSRLEAIKVMQAGTAMFPESPKLHAIGDAVMTSAERADDPASITLLKTLGYVGGK